MKMFGPKWGYIPFAETFQQNAHCLKLFRDMKNRVSMKNSIGQKSSYRQSNFKEKKNSNNSIFGKSSFTLKLDFLKMEFQNRSIFLNSFKHGAFCWKVSAEGVFCHFAQMFDTTFVMGFTFNENFII